MPFTKLVGLAFGAFFLLPNPDQPKTMDDEKEKQCTSNQIQHTFALNKMLERKFEELQHATTSTYPVDMVVHQYDNGYTLYLRVGLDLALGRFFFKDGQFQGIETLKKSTADEFPLASRELIAALTLRQRTSPGTIFTAIQLQESAPGCMYATEIEDLLCQVKAEYDKPEAYSNLPESYVEVQTYNDGYSMSFCVDDVCASTKMFLFRFALFTGIEQFKMSLVQSFPSFSAEEINSLRVEVCSHNDSYVEHGPFYTFGDTVRG
jgi:hypothetical protein